MECGAGDAGVVLEGGDLDAPYSTTVSIGDQNVKLDVIDPGVSGGIAVSAALLPTTEPAEALTLPALPVVEDMPAPETLEVPEPELAFF